MRARPGRGTRGYVSSRESIVLDQNGRGYQAVHLADALFGWEARLRSAALLSSDAKSQSSLFQAMLDDQSEIYLYLKFHWILQRC